MILIPVLLIILLLWVDYYKRHTVPRFPHAPSNFKEGYCRAQHHRNQVQVLPSEVILGYLESLFQVDIQTERVLWNAPATGEFNPVNTDLDREDGGLISGSEGTEVGALWESR